ncbi:MAG TPA: hypothetical protein VFZ32_21545 [Micromonosporaceae bacterium]
MRRDGETRPGGLRAGQETNDGAASVRASGGLASLPARLRCPLVRAAYRLHDPGVLSVVERVHPPEFCPAARREAA